MRALSILLAMTLAFVPLAGCFEGVQRPDAGDPEGDEDAFERERQPNNTSAQEPRRSVARLP